MTNKTTLFEHPICKAEGFPVETRAGTQTFIRLVMDDWVNVVVVTTQDELVLIRQHRWGVDAETLEIPGGVIDPGESPAEAALREVREETGYGDGKLIALGRLAPNPAIQNNAVYMFALIDARIVQQPDLDPAEDITVHLHGWSDTMDLVSNGTIDHALVVAALHTAHSHLR